MRLNPNVPFKTRGNAAVALALEIPEGDIEELWRLAVEVVSTNTDFVGKTSPAWPWRWGRCRRGLGLCIDTP